MENTFFVRYKEDENLINLTETKNFKKSKGFFGLWFFYWKKYKFKSLAVIFLILLVSAISVFNILIARQLTALLVTETMMSTFKNADMMVTIVNELLNEATNKPGGILTQEQMEELIKWLANSGMGISDDVINIVIHKYYFDYITVIDGIARADFLFFHIAKIEWVWILLGSISIIILLMYSAYCLCGEISEDANTDLKNKLVKSLLNKNIEFYNQNSQGKITETIVKDSKNIANQLKVAPIIIIFIIFSTFGSIGMLIYIDLIISLLMFALILFVLLLALIVVLAISKPVKNSIEERSKHDSEITEKIAAIRLIKSSGTWVNEEIQNNIETEKNNRKNKKLNFAISIIPGIIIGAMGCLTLSSMIFGVFIYGENTQKLITVFSSFTAGIFVMVTPIFQLNTILQSINETNKSSQNIGEIVTDENNVIEKNLTQIVENNKINKIEFKNVEFAYPSNPNVPVIRDLNIILEQGKSYAFVGPSGSGKSTITRLIMRFYEDFSGQININDNLEIRDISLKNWMDNIGYVDQEPQILSATVRENLRYIKENATDEEIIEACKKAKIHDLIMSFSEGYDTFLQERGKQLSGGQKQRLVIARMFLKDPSLIILDEATSALDNLVEKEISAELEKLIVGKTTIAIAHRLSTIKNYDKIFVLDTNKRIVQTGTFIELIKQPGLFKELYEVGKENE
ncbi:ABC transporter ATP-binding protein [Spiroplasma diminutum]|uniref:ABC transporter ATP-binding protein/permease n=1 Tax=Spiroplasma diminutum CUAS-1 TaxID=1276221 RepID=S5M196_9MOLU|nr:ABC transporter ATP-binding protein/permease [Spiroplasma diminutum]AGR41812.1 ABC transporter ATP-binding protein/permease [Spiroplasma diminutum CUAS-1]